MPETQTHNPNHQHSLPDTLNPNLMAVLGEPDQAVVDALHPHDLTMQDDIEGTISAFHSLPFLKAKEVRESLTYPDGNGTGQEIAQATFPISRIVSVSGFESWAGRGRSNAEIGPNPDYQPTIQLFKDRDGIVWGFMDTDGAHRTAGTKARGDRELQCTVRTDAYDRLPASDLSIAETLLAQHKIPQKILG